MRPWSVVVGAFCGGLWLLSFGLLSDSLTGYVWWTVGAGAVAWLVAAALVRFGDRGVAVGVAAATGVAWTAATLSVVAQWVRLGGWPL